MHYGDDHQLANTVLKIGVYLHGAFGDTPPLLQIASILEARLVRPSSMVRVITGRKLKKMLIPLMTPETWYVVTLGGLESGDTQILSLEEVADTDTEDWKRLH